jgi:hypothetical protein
MKGQMLDPIKQLKILDKATKEAFQEIKKTRHKTHRNYFKEFYDWVDIVKLKIRKYLD